MKHFVIIFVVVLFYSTDIMSQTVDVSDIMQKSLDALESAIKSGDDYARCAALCDVAAADLVTSLDAEAENYAAEAEAIARKRHYPDLLARALTIKANVCAYAETDSLFNRNDEGLGYALEAADNAELAASDSLLMEACCSASQLYVNKNRWNKTLDSSMYSLAGYYLDRADSLSGIVHLAKGSRLLAYRMRWYRQGGLIEKAIDYCEKTFEACVEDDYLLKTQICDQLTSLYIEAGRFEEAGQAHSACIHYHTIYDRQCEKDRLQELQGTYESKLKDEQLRKRTYQVISLVAALLLAAAVSFVLVYIMIQERRKRIESERENLAKDELIGFMSKDLRNPLNSTTGELERFVSNAGRMNEEQIIAESKKLLEEKRNLSRDVAEYVSDIVIKRKKVMEDFGLSPREMEIVRLSAEGLSAAQIAGRLFISTRTVSNHKANIYSKMGIRTNAEMCRLAQDSGLI